MSIQVRPKWTYKSIEPVCYIDSQESSELRPTKPVEAKELHLKYLKNRLKVYETN